MVPRHKAISTLAMRVKRPLVWGLLYIFIWEGFVARAGPTAARLAVRAYGSSILNHFTDAKIVLGDKVQHHFL